VNIRTAIIPGRGRVHMKDLYQMVGAKIAKPDAGSLVRMRKIKE
jgi:hypothetical protein